MSTTAIVIFGVLILLVLALFVALMIHLETKYYERHPEKTPPDPLQSEHM